MSLNQIQLHGDRTILNVPVDAHDHDDMGFEQFMYVLMIMGVFTQVCMHVPGPM